MTFAAVHLKSNATGATVKGEFVLETSNAWQVAVDGKVRVFLKSEWTSTASPIPTLDDLLRGFGGGF